MKLEANLKILLSPVSFFNYYFYFIFYELALMQSKQINNTVELEWVGEELYPML